MLHVISDLDHGGSQTQLGLLAEAAIARGESVVVVSLRRPGPMAERLRQAGVEVVWLGRRFSFDPLALAQLLRQIRRWRPDVIQSWDAASAAFCRAARRLGGTPWIQTLRDPSERPAAGADLTIAADAHAAERVGGSTLIVPNAFNPTIAPTDRDAKLIARERLRGAGADVSDSAPVVVAVARLDRPQAMNELVWAADLLRVVCPGLRMLVVGEGPARMACQRFAARAVEPGLVVWSGGWPDLVTVYAATDVVWCGAGGGTSPTPALEALAAGKPLVLAEAAGREILAPDAPEVGSAGLRPEWNDRAAWARATRRLLEDPELAARVGRESAERVRERHAIAAVSTQHAEAIRTATA